MPSEFDQYAQQGYEDLLKDPLKQSFGESLDFFLKVKADHLVEHCALSPKTTQRHLDLGCGNGHFAGMVRAHVKHSIGLEPSFQMMDASCGLPFVQGDGCRLPFPDDSFELITLICILHHVPLTMRSTLMAEVKRVTKPGGHIAIYEHNTKNPVTRSIVARTPVDRDAVLLPIEESLHLLASYATKSGYLLFFPERVPKFIRRLEKWLPWFPLGGQYFVIATKS